VSGQVPDDPELRERLAGPQRVDADGVPMITRLAAYGILRDAGGRLLLCRVAAGNLGEGLWTLPGGGIEFGEAPETAAVREVEEETGLIGRIDGVPEVTSDTGTWPRPGGEWVRFHTVRFVYPMSVVGGEERVEVGGSTDAFAWLTPAEIDELGDSGRLGHLVERVRTQRAG
jgi:ADP-ribose pyrophosphatase YjhB (NUDIX family)